MQKTRLPGKHIRITFEAFDDKGTCVGAREYYISDTKLRSEGGIQILPMEANYAARLFWDETVQMGFLD